MKTKLILLASLALGTAAFAQDATPMPSAPAASDTTPAPAPSATPDAATQATPAPTTDANASAPVNDAAVMPSAGAATADASTYPACSRSVTDKCVQSHERHSRMRPR